MKDPESASARAAMDVITMAIAGVAKRSWIREIGRGNWPASDMAKSKRVPGVREAPKTPAQAIIAASAMITAPVDPTSDAAASASGRGDSARFGSAATQTTCISEYRTMK